MKHLGNNNILYEYQHGFRHNRSCETQLVSLISYDNGKQIDVIFMDIAKAFDTVPHNRLRHISYSGMVLLVIPTNGSHLS